MLVGLQVLGLAAVAYSTGEVNNTGKMNKADECTSRGGTASGSCAQGYGVCCIVSITCGSSSSQNCTYFDSTGSSGSGSSCIVKICPISNCKICQLRLDFVTFSIAQPSTSTVSAVKTIFGQPASTLNVKGVTQTLASQCQTDSFYVTSLGNPVPPVICGLNTGQHMYVDVAQSCNSLAMDLGIPASTASTATRAWQIKVTQYACDYPYLAPTGCTQYFFGSTTRTFQTFNFDAGAHLANQNQKFCFRKERGTCRICYSLSSKADFQTSYKAPNKLVYGLSYMFSACCGYSSKSGTNKNGYDCLLLPAATKAVGSAALSVNELCGGGGVAATMLTQGGSSSVCSRLLPFELSFISDAYETAIEVTGGSRNVGFRLHYQLRQC